MSKTKHIIRLRNEIDDLVNDAFRRSDSATLSTDDILVKVKQKLKAEIADAQQELTDLALKRLIDGVGRRKAGRRRYLGERDLFGEYRQIPQTVTVGDKKRKRTSKLSIVEAQHYLESHSPKAISERYDAFKRLVDDCLPFRTSDDDTIEELIERRKQALSEEGKSAFDWSKSGGKKDDVEESSAELPELAE